MCFKLLKVLQNITKTRQEEKEKELKSKAYSSFHDNIIGIIKKILIKKKPNNIKKDH
jgi:hypothetical protein